MRHRVQKKTFGRDINERRALFRSLVGALVEHGRIETTLAKAKELRRHAEKAITLGKRGTVHARRILAARYPNPDLVKSVFDEIAPRFKTRSGGYTRVLKTGRRPGDNAPMALIEWVDFTPAKSTSKATKTAKAKEGVEEASAAPKKKAAKKVAKKKTAKKKTTSK